MILDAIAAFGCIQIVVIEIPLFFTIIINIRRRSNEAICIVDTNRQCRDRSFLSVGEGYLFTTLFGERHRCRKLYKTGKIYFSIANLGLDNFAVKVKNHRIIAASP